MYNYFETFFFKHFVQLYNIISRVLCLLIFKNVYKRIDCFICYSSCVYITHDKSVHLYIFINHTF